MWKTLCPFWGEEYQVHLPPTFHTVAFYIMDEDALRWVVPTLPLGPRPCHLSLSGPFHCWSLCILFKAWREGESRRVWKGTGVSVCVSVCGCTVLVPHAHVWEYRHGRTV